MLTNKSWHVCVKLALCLVFLFSLSSMGAEGERPNVNFNHDQTTFPLRGLHSNTACESCHINGVFKGTPNTCEGCHSRGGASTAKLKPSTHIPTTESCSSCHISQGWIPATFRHLSNSLSCQVCHDGVKATGKPSTHISTTQSCGTCHSTGAWRPAAYYDHNGVVPGTCKDCHNGSRATGQPSNHRTILSCDSCHNTAAWLPGKSYNHSSSLTGCANCHNNSFVSGKPNGHMITSEACESCHTAATFPSWLPVNFSHTGITNSCARCHQKPTVHPVTNPINKDCSDCHGSTTSWVLSLSGHRALEGKTCIQCHYSGGVGPAAPAANPPHGAVSAVNCDACHRISLFPLWTVATYSHSGISGNCETCHGSAPTGPAKVKINVGTHFNITGASVTCEKCHVTSSWSSVKAYVHNSGDGYVAHAGSPACTACHINNAALIAGAPHYGNSAYKPDCAWCHSGQFPTPGSKNQQAHIKTSSPLIYYTVGELSKCGGECHRNGSTTIISGVHRATSGSFGN